jgi:D-alanyl-D-alanine carboxypeptidase
MRRLIVAMACLSILLPSAVFAKTTTASKGPTLKKEATEYVREADAFTSAVMIDVKTGKELYTYQPDKVWPIASLTKLMNSLVFLDQKPNLNRIVSMKASDEVGGGRLRVSVGSRLSIRDLIYSAIVGSANNAAMAMSRVSGLSQKTFIAKMNSKAKTLGLKTAHFADPAGMDPANVMSARDMIKLAKIAFATPAIQGPASTAKYTFAIRNNGGTHTIKNTNALLVDDTNGLLVMGGKTGYLVESQYNFAVEMRGSSTSSPKLLVVVFGASSMPRSASLAQGLAEWAWNAYAWPSK